MRSWATCFPPEFQVQNQSPEFNWSKCFLSTISIPQVNLTAAHRVRKCTEISQNSLKVKPCIPLPEGCKHVSSVCVCLMKGGSGLTILQDKPTISFNMFYPESLPLTWSLTDFCHWPRGLSKSEWEGLKSPSLRCARNQRKYPSSSSATPSDAQHSGNLLCAYTHWDCRLSVYKMG